MTKRLHLLHKTGTTIEFDVESASAVPSVLVPGGFNITYRTDDVTLLFLRSQDFDAVILVDGPAEVIV